VVVIMIFYSIVLSLIFLCWQSKLDLKDKNVSNKLSWITFYIGLVLVTLISLNNPILFITWLLGILITSLFFYKIKKTFPSQFGSGDLWMLIGLQALNPHPIASVLIIFSIAATLHFVYTIKKEKEIGFAPFLLTAYPIFLFLLIFF